MSVKRARAERRRKARKEQQGRRRASQHSQTGSAGQAGQTGQRDHSGQAGQGGHAGASLDAALDRAVLSWGADPGLDERLLDALAGFGREARDRVESLLVAQLPLRWARGWTPSDLVHVVDRLATSAHGDEAARAAIADAVRRQRAGTELDPRWVSQVESLDERARATADGRTLRTRLALSLDLLDRLARLTDLPETIPPPGSSLAAAGLRSAGLDERMLTRIRALLAKAESTDFPEESEALMAKAQELLARHALDAALLDEPERVGAPSVRRIHLDDPYASAKATIIATVARANRSHVVYDSGYLWLTAFGFEADLDALELLGTSLLVQATAAMARQGSRRDAAGRSRTRSFRHAFLLGFAQRIGQRLDEAERSQVGAATSADRASALPVLAAREDAVEEAVSRAFPRLSRGRTQASNAAGWSAGHVAGGMADLTGGRQQVGRTA